MEREAPRVASVRFSYFKFEAGRQLLVPRLSSELQNQECQLELVADRGDKSDMLLTILEGRNCRSKLERAERSIRLSLHLA